jgi:hypothetical protein
MAYNSNYPLFFTLILNDHYGTQTINWLSYDIFYPSLVQLIFFPVCNPIQFLPFTYSREYHPQNF